MKEKKIKYINIYNHIQNKIADGTYSIGDFIPTEPELTKQHNASRITVRHAVDLLVEEGYVRRIHGVGTVVLNKKRTLPLQNLLGFSEENKNERVSSTLITCKEKIINNPIIYSTLDVSQNTPINCLERLRWLNDILIGFQRSYCPPSINLSVSEFDFPESSLYETFYHKGHIVTDAKETIESIIADNQIAKLLKIEKGSPLLYIQRTTYNQHNQIIEYAEAFYKGDKYRYEIQLKA